MTTSARPIHPRAVVGPEADLADDVTVAPYAIVEDGAVIGPGSEIGEHAVIRAQARIGSDVRIFPGAVIAEVPQDVKFDPSVEDSWVAIGDGVVIREHVTINRANHSGDATRIGDGALLMTYSHVGHDVVLEEEVVLANSVQIAGHCHVGRRAFVGGGSAVHQFCRIGEVAMIRGVIGVTRDVPPFCVAADWRGNAAGTNLVGLRRDGLSAETIRAIGEAYHLFYRSGRPRSEALDEIEETLGDVPEVQRFVAFCRADSERGICREVSR